MSISLENLNLKVGNKYTVLKPNSLVPELYQFTLVNYYISNYAQYENCLFLVVKLKNHRKTSRIVIAHETAYIFNRWSFAKSWNKERVKDNSSLLHRIKSEDIKDNKDLICIVNREDNFKANDDNYSFIDYTTDYMINNNVRGKDQLNNEGYYSYIKSLLMDRLYNTDNLIKQCRAWEYIYIVDILNKIQLDY